MNWINAVGFWWLTAAVILAAVELLVPGVYLIFIALAAALTGAVALLFDLHLAGQLVSFAAWSVVTVVIGRRWYRDFPVATSDPMLNDRAARLVGEVVTVVEPIEGGRGRVRVGDGEWPAEGPDTPAGTRVRIVSARGTALTVEPLPPRIESRAE